MWEAGILIIGFNNISSKQNRLRIQELETKNKTTRKRNRITYTRIPTYTTGTEK